MKCGSCTVLGRFMSAGDMSRLQRALDAPETDWNDLNKDATFKMKYKQRSGEIQDILAEMLTTFNDNRDEAVTAEGKAVPRAFIFEGTGDRLCFFCCDVCVVFCR